MLGPPAEIRATRGRTLGHPELAPLWDRCERLGLTVVVHEGTHAEVAAAMNEPLGTVKAWIRRGMLELRPKLEKYL